MPDALMLFAAGFGTRMGTLTRRRPKPLIRVAGRALIDHALALAAEAGIERCVVNTHYLGDQIAAHLSGRNNVALSHETPEILDTGGGLRHALPLLGEGPVYTLNSDAVWTGPNPLARLASAWAPDRMDALLLLVPLDRARGRIGDGDFEMGRDGVLRRGRPLVYTGAQILKTDRVRARSGGVFSLNEIWDEIAEDGRLFGAVHAGGWCDIGHPTGIAEGEAMLAAAL